ncbi:hypothetical protein Xcel_3192 [Xylanimonas cellulosilytica DSM 15894]|uniref:Uncharacterized protein n=1 Tax=Xylanimonas cellulosilytica (strain DSM 15894 / JCM 12276 / CECT 5975 / KCTC 9989 / LMG 20990 / NBRC 107835 / XIL07) TaxID=446471 RepID=D1C0I9_XYLCX|nr:hypothetical protein [Xylanimonas cellulosilytica]ACZ32192.1 hypothetical protein Xcel_3192 [Xylanimonas cellulosilytica DSM 15894]
MTEPHVLVVPAARADALPELAAAWFADVAWLREPAAAPAPRARVGLFRPTAEPETVPGMLRLGERHALTGPLPVGAEQATAVGLAPGGAWSAWSIAPADGQPEVRQRRPASYDDRDGISRAFAAGLPEAEELRAVQWGVAVARKVGGALVADGVTPLTPDPGSAVDLTLYSSHALEPADLLQQVRGLIATAELGARGQAPDGSLTYAVRARTSYDGELLVRVEHVDRVPRALGVMEWRQYGPFAYRLSWVPQDPYELQTEHPSGLHLIARGRMASIVARLAAALQARVAGVLVDDGGFVATAEELGARIDGEHSGAQAWV